jgi:hypothetical protein
VINVFCKVEYLGFYPLGDEVEINGIKIMQSEWTAYRELLIPYGKKNVVNPAFGKVYYVQKDGATVFFVAIEYGLGHYHVFKSTDKDNCKLSKKITKVD